MATIVHFNISADRTDRAKTFYEKAFGWKFIALPESLNYYLIETWDLDGQKGVGGGLAKKANPQTPGFVNFIGVQSLDETIQKIEALGGSVTEPKHVIPHWGYFAICKDPENNQIGIFQEDEKAL